MAEMIASFLDTHTNQKPMILILVSICLDYYKAEISLYFSKPEH